MGLYRLRSAPTSWLVKSVKRAEVWLAVDATCEHSVVLPLQSHFLCISQHF